jgi:signal transduction histidine kinase
MAIDRRRFLALPVIGVPAMVIGKRLGILASLKSSFFALRGASLTAESIPKSLVPLELDELERAGVARELHDGTVQSLIAIQMQMDVLRRQSLAQANPLASELGRIQGLIREEVLRLRELVQQMKPFDVDSSTFLGFLEGTVERFQRETGISARFVSELDEVKIPQRVCRELACIVQEGLVNVRSHNGAQHVQVRLTTTDRHWQVRIEDDGRGFRRDPMVIRERVRLIEGELKVESSPSRGSRLEVTVPKRPESTSGRRT